MYIMRLTLMRLTIHNAFWHKCPDDLHRIPTNCDFGTRKEKA